MKNIVRLTVGVNKVNVANSSDSFEEILDLLDTVSLTHGEIILLPRLALCSPSSGSLLGNSFLLEEQELYLTRLKEASEKIEAYLIVGFCVEDIGRPVSTMAILYKGDLIALIPTSGDPSPLVQSGTSNWFAPTDSVLAVENMRVQLHVGSLSSLVKGATLAAENFCDLLLVPLYEPMVAGKIDEICRLASSLSSSLGMAIAIVNGGISDTSFPYFYHGFTTVYENGKQLIFNKDYSQNIVSSTDLDVDIIRFGRSASLCNAPSAPIYQIPAYTGSRDFLRSVPKNPFLPVDSWSKAEYVSELFQYQTLSLVSRMRNTGMDKLVLGVSGGIDSTSALMASVAACDYLGLPRANIHGITLPGLGTSDRTYYNALALLEQFGTTRRDISIRPAVLQHFEDIGHSGNHDTTYENAQARERTQILFDISNMVGGLVIGTGDLSEEALGFATFGGDHFAGYNVNCCMTKTMLREQLSYLVDNGLYPEVDSIIRDVLDTPVSPELLPPSADGEITQKTEEILGPYELHEFFLYYFIAYGMQPSKIFAYACEAFRGAMLPSFIKEKLALFIRKFCANQFKRSCAPDAASITAVNVLGVNYTISSDLDPSALLSDLNKVDQPTP